MFFALAVSSFFPARFTIFEFRALLLYVPDKLSVDCMNFDQGVSSVEIFNVDSCLCLFATSASTQLLSTQAPR